MSSREWITKKIKNYGRVGLVLVFAACTTSGPVATLQVDSRYEIVPEPKAFVSPLVEIERVRHRTLESESATHRRPLTAGRQWLEYASWAQAWDEREAEQHRLEQELARTGEVELLPGRSYSFDLESYCVQGGEARPVTGDELKAAPLRGAAEAWLPKILDTQGEQRLSQSQVQYLIWALLYDVRFDELSEENQRALLLFYPDAASRFGNRRLEEVSKNILRDVLPSEITSIASQITEYRDRILELHSDYGKIEQVLAPKSDRENPIPVGWMRMPDGYFMRLTSKDYTQVHVDIFVPEESDPGRGPQAIKPKKIFRPSQWVGLPARGQRLAISTKTIPRPKRDHKTLCDRNRDYRPKYCHEMTDQDRKKILSISDPKLFGHTRYHQKPGGSDSIEEESDCSSFVNEIYRRAGFDFPYSPTSDFRCFSVFSLSPVKEFKPGDLILYPGHIGIMTSDGQVISATMGGKLGLSKLPKDDPRFRPAIKKLTPEQSSNSPPLGVLKWNCP
jgi:hypothetical protein